MMRYIRDLRLVPIALIASACLLVLKTADLLLEHWDVPAAQTPVASEPTVVHLAPDAPRVQSAMRSDGTRRSWAQEMFDFPDSRGGQAAQPTTSLTRELPAIASLPERSNADIITGSVNETRDKDKEKPKGEGESPPAKEGGDARESRPGTIKDTPPGPTVIQVEGAPLPNGSERAILGRLQERRQELDRRARELDIREGLIQEAEKRVETKLNEVKDVQAKIDNATESKKEADTVRLKSIVTMYENMKARDAAKIFDRLEIGVLIEVASHINPRSMSEIMAQMSPDVAERLTVELASRARDSAKGVDALPKIEGRPVTQ
jgi:flagellar motility protein MotE (MotC chaperone)